MKIKKRADSGFSLVEVLTASVILMFVIIAFYSLIISNQATQVTEENKTDMNQGARALDQVLCENIRNAGSILSILYTPNFLGTSAPFTGVYPLNNDDYPDGIILASGDYRGVTELTSDFTPGGTTLLVEKTLDPDGINPAWSKGDTGMVVRSKGYYLFKVTGNVNPGDTTLSVRANPVYYSGLLNVPGKYRDYSSDSNHLGELGNSGAYTIGAPVIRLNYFSIFLTKTETDGTRTLTLTTDTEGASNILATGMETSTRAIPIITNIQDIQFEYFTKNNPPELWASSSTDYTSYSDPCSTPGDPNCINFIQNINNKNISSIRIYALFKTEDKHLRKSLPSGSVGQEYAKPLMGDSPAVKLSAGRFHYTYMTYEVLIRNFNIIY